MDGGGGCSGVAVVVVVVVVLTEHSGGHDSNIVVVGGNGNHILKVVIMEIVPAHRIIPLLTAHDLVSMSPCPCCAANSGGMRFNVM